MKIRWRGTWGVGDFMQALNASHNYCFKNKTTVNLEMHWRHDEDYLHHPKDPETIIQRMDWLHTQYHRQDDVTVTHVFNSQLFPYNNLDTSANKTRCYFDDKPVASPKNDWIFKPESFVPKRKKIVIWTPTYNSQAPRTWKNFLTSDDWYDIIKLLSWEGWILVELTYRTPISVAFKQISEADFIVCYDGMWHLIARNFGKPMFIPSWEGITEYNTPQAIRRPILDLSKYKDNPSGATAVGRKDVKKFFGDGNKKFEPNLTKMKTKAKVYLKNLKKYHED
jgi:hypothetical protein